MTPARAISDQAIKPLLGATRCSGVDVGPQTAARRVLLIVYCDSARGGCACLGSDVAIDRLKRSVSEIWRAASAAMAHRLWWTTSMLCPSGSRTNAP